LSPADLWHFCSPSNTGWTGGPNLKPPQNSKRENGWRLRLNRDAVNGWLPIGKPAARCVFTVARPRCLGISTDGLTEALTCAIGTTHCCATDAEGHTRSFALKHLKRRWRTPHPRPRSLATNRAVDQASAGNHCLRSAHEPSSGSIWMLASAKSRVSR